jgi:hypothetical protein
MITNNNIELIGMNKRFYCQKMIHSEKSISIYRIQTFTNWYLFFTKEKIFLKILLFCFSHIKEECLRIIQRTNNVLELDTVSLSKDNSCSNLNTNNYNFYMTFYTKSFFISNSCPNYLGHLIFQSNIDYYLKRKSFHMSIGCYNKQKLIISQKEKGL